MSLPFIIAAYMVNKGFRLKMNKISATLRLLLTRELPSSVNDISCSLII